MFEEEDDEGGCELKMPMGHLPGWLIRGYIDGAHREKSLTQR